MGLTISGTIVGVEKFVLEPSSAFIRCHVTRGLYSGQCMTVGNSMYMYNREVYADACHMMSN